jgi:predicted DNA-binding transcriptional regulator AlpA
MSRPPATPQNPPQRVTANVRLRRLFSQRGRPRCRYMRSKTDAAPGVHVDPDGVHWWTIEAVASGLLCSPRTARRLTRRAGFPSGYRIGSLLRWRADDVRTWRDAQRTSEVLPTPADWTPAHTPDGRKGRRGPRAKAGV